MSSNVSEGEPDDAVDCENGGRRSCRPLAFWRTFNRHIVLLFLCTLFALYMHYKIHIDYARLASTPPLILDAYSERFKLRNALVGHAFFDEFIWETLDDPTHGRVNYVGQEGARVQNLSFASDDKFIMRADAQSVIHPRARGRDSVRIISREAYEDSVIVLDVQHMPEGCATWPAFWTLSREGPWPKGGEIDIIEGVNLDTQNTASLHTLPGCKVPSERHQLGTPTSNDCNAFANFNAGCGTSFTGPGTYGASFNARGGGHFVLTRTAQTGSAVYFWPRGDEGIPDMVRDVEAREVAPGAYWGTPQARFAASEECEFRRFFDAHRIVFDLTFCGDWAGATFASSLCGLNCEAYVNDNPQEFEKAYWEINSLRIYTPV